MTRIYRRRRGITAVLAMLYLVIFGVMAVGFYAATTTATQVSENERRTSAAAFAAESGMDFVRYQLAQVVIPHGTPPSQLFTTVYEQLEYNIEGTPNLGVGSVSMWGNVISIPANPDSYITLNGNTGAQFRATVENLGQKVRVKVIGRANGITVRRAVQLDYDLAEKASAIFDFGVASKGKIWTDGSSKIRGATDPTKGSVLSTCLTDPTPVVIRGKEVSGDISVTNASANIVFSGASVGGTTDPAEIAAHHIHKGVAEPEFPTIDTAAFEAYATNTYVAGQTNLVNCRIPANTNPTFAANTQIQGVLYIETPNVVKFRGNVDVHGTIVTQNEPTGTVATNILDFSGNVRAQGIETLPESFGDLRQLTGSFLLAPKFHAKFSGNFGTVNGSIMADKISMTGNAGGTVVGTVVNLANNMMTVYGSSEIIIASTGTTNYPAGVFFSSRYVPLPDTYEEVRP